MAVVIPESRIFEIRKSQLGLEKFTASADFTDLLASGDTLASATVGAWDYEHKTNVSSGSNKVISSQTASISSPNASIALVGGTQGRDYQITFYGTTTGGDNPIIDLLMRVR